MPVALIIGHGMDSPDKPVNDMDMWMKPRPNEAQSRGLVQDKAPLAEGGPGSSLCSPGNSPPP